MYRYFKERLHVNNFWELKGQYQLHLLALPNFKSIHNPYQWLVILLCHNPPLNDHTHHQTCLQLNEKIDDQKATHILSYLS